MKEGTQSPILRLDDIWPTFAANEWQVPEVIARRERERQRQLLHSLLSEKVQSQRDEAADFQKHSFALSLSEFLRKSADLETFARFVREEDFSSILLKVEHHRKKYQNIRKTFNEYHDWSYFLGTAAEAVGQIGLREMVRYLERPTLQLMHGFDDDKRTFPKLDMKFSQGYNVILFAKTPEGKTVQEVDALLMDGGNSPSITAIDFSTSVEAVFFKKCFEDQQKFPDIQQALSKAFGITEERICKLHILFTDPKEENSTDQIEALRLPDGGAVPDNFVVNIPARRMIARVGIAAQKAEHKGYENFLRELTAPKSLPLRRAGGLYSSS